MQEDEQNEQNELEWDFALCDVGRALTRFIILELDRQHRRKLPDVEEKRKLLKADGALIRAEFAMRPDLDLKVVVEAVVDSAIAKKTICDFTGYVHPAPDLSNPN